MTVRRVATFGVVVASLTGCAMSSPRSDALDSLEALDGPATPSTTTAPATVPTDNAPTTISASQRECEVNDLATKSLRPHADGNVDAFVEEIRERGYLKVGVDENTLGFSTRDPGTGEWQGFEVDLAREIAKRIFGDDEPDDVHFVPVASGEKREFVINGTVDFTISANTMTCDRWEEVLFSSEYYRANQTFLVHKESDLESVGDVAGAKICVTSPSSSQNILEDEVPEAELVKVPERIDCLVELQEGRAEAYFGHDSFQYGMISQDPGLEMRPLLPDDVTESNYGIAIHHEHEGFVRFVNDVLQEVRGGTWQRLHQQLEDEAGIPEAVPPAAEYRD